jgi:hypothetical protein
MNIRVPINEQGDVAGQPAQRRQSAGDSIPPNCQVIEVHVAELNQLFNAIDPAPFRERDEKVESGLYNNASGVVREGLRPLKEPDEIRLRWREQIERP